MKSSKNKTTILGLATGFGIAALWIGISIALRTESPTKAPTKVVVSQRTPSSSPYDIRPSLIRFRDRELNQEITPSRRGDFPGSETFSLRDVSILLKELPGDLSDAEVNLLFDWLREGPGSSSLSVPEYAHLANEVLNVLHRQKYQPLGFAKLVTELANDGGQPDLVRDYAVQHLRTVWNDLPVDSKDRPLLTGALWEQVDSRHPSRSGTALLALHQLGMTREGFVPEGDRQIPDSAFQDRLPLFLTRENEPAASRLVALRIIADRSLDSHLDSVRNLVGDTSQNTVVRLRAIATLGVIGTEDDVAALNEFQEDSLLNAAASSALKKLSEDPS